MNEPIAEQIHEQANEHVSEHVSEQVKESATTPIITKAGFVAIIGEPNVGKSTLMNAILGTKLSIVTPKPQTTRKSILGIHTEGDTQIVFFDTPGVLTPSYELHRSMMDFVKTSIEGADAVLVVVDVEKMLSRQQGRGIRASRNARKSANKLLRTAPTTNDGLQSLMLVLQTRLETIGKPVIVALNKMDAVFDKKLALPIMDALMKTEFVTHVAPISALENKFVDDLVSVLRAQMPVHEFYYDEEMLSTHPQRFFAGEIIREAVFMRYREEIPYSTEVNVVEFKEREDGEKWYISAEIIVERDTQKQIIIGKGGAALKELGSTARQAIEEHLEMPIFLEIFVKVREDWRNSQAHLHSFGYGVNR
jgi:GTPase